MEILFFCTWKISRKSAKGKAKKQKRKEESAKYAMSFAKVEAANKIKDPLDLVAPFRKFERNGISLKVEFFRAQDLTQEMTDWVFDLTKKNMQKLYEESDWGWKDREKLEEMTEEKALYLIALDSESKPVAFTHFRFDMEWDEELVYCYELQVIDEYRRKGIGKFLIQILELLAYKTEMVKVMLTTFKSNKIGETFFMKAMKYTLDETSPEDPVWEETEYKYQILSKEIKPKPTSKTQEEAMQTSPVKAASA
ncbi:N-alpha-acetyltransferase 40-like isoform X1 [Mizuhopecten yessoensis]|uniref:N-alpha-acetyltransferase 40-like isoform X1 n=1 Tax=Mizuhopecten yessoensis TaxID=6573 RepID=UPI000B45A86F|nr:N-alpha-acetyltransferase 40-like isoform X1 [Mizuhopecten yessoensis]